MQWSNKNILSWRRHPVLICLVVLAIIWLVARAMMPPLMNGMTFSAAYYDRHGTLMRMTLTDDDKYRLYTPLADIDKNLQRATILYEDKYFYYHPGVNPVALFRAFKNWARGASHPAGASTITMQVARIKYDMNSKHPLGKLAQIAAAIYIDLMYPKDEILEAYLNLAPYGANIEGAGAASQVYFHRRANALGVLQSITLATVPQNPTKRGLNTTTGLENMRRMRGDLVRRWTAEYGADSDLETLAAMDLHVYGLRDLPFLAPHFVDREISRAHTNQTASYGEIKTTLDLGLQSHLARQLKSEVARRKSVGIENAAAILVNYKTREVLAHIGSVDYFDRTIYGENDGVYARRSPGSTLKPFIYAHAVDDGLIHGMTLLKDARINFGVYAPENSDNEFYGPILARDALTHSRNIPAIDLVRKIGVRNFYKMLTDMGVTGLRTPSHYGVSIALGGAEVSMFELAQMYVAMANLGDYDELRTRLDAPKKHDAKQILSREAFFITLDMLGRAPTPSHNTPFARQQKRTVHHYWKTGTSSSYRDAWTAGIFGDYVLIVWVGNFDGQPNNAFSGARAAAPIYFSLADRVTEYMNTHGTPVMDNNFLRDDMNIVLVDMCDGVGGIANEHCPRTVKTYFIPGKSPIDASTVYRAVAIDNATGLRACTNDATTTHMDVYEFWDAEFLDMFKRAGITRKTPPNYMPGCNLTGIAAMRTPPIITTPADGTRIVITDNRDTTNVAFQAVIDSADARIFWFLDNQKIGTTTSGQVLNIPVAMGEHTIRALDELGAGLSHDFSVVK